MRRILQWTLVPVAVAAVACKSDKPTQTSMSDDLKRDLQAASATQNIRISPDEITPKAHQELALRPKRAPDGNKVIRTEKPTVKASAAPVQVAEIKTNIPQIQVLAAAPAPSETPSTDAPPLARPAPVPTPSYPGAAPIPGDGGGNGAGTIMGGIFGAVIRGGGVGDDDHCDPRPTRRGGRPVGGDIFTMPGTGGMGGSRIPIMGGRPRGR